MNPLSKIKDKVISKLSPNTAKAAGTNVYETAPNFKSYTTKKGRQYYASNPDGTKGTVFNVPKTTEKTGQDTQASFDDASQDYDSRYPVLNKPPYRKY